MKRQQVYLSSSARTDPILPEELLTFPSNTILYRRQDNNQAVEPVFVPFCERLSIQDYFYVTVAKIDGVATVVVKTHKQVNTSTVYRGVREEDREAGQADIVHILRGTKTSDRLVSVTFFDRLLKLEIDSAPTRPYSLPIAPIPL